VVYCKSMPPNRAAYLRRRFRQADAGLVRASEYLAEVWATYRSQHPELGPHILALMGEMDAVRLGLLIFYREVLGGTERGLWREEDRGRIVEEARPVPNPHYD